MPWIKTVRYEEASGIIGFFNYYARVADALGVGPEPHWAEG